MNERDPARRSYDVVVVGGGVLGQSIARELARAAVNVLLVYPRNHGRDSATLAAGAMIGAFGELTHAKADLRDRTKLEFRIRSQELHPAWLDGLREESGVNIFTTQGLFMIANAGGREDRRNLQRIKAELEAYGRRSEWVAPAEVPCLQPHDAYRAHEALFINDDLTIDSADLLAALGRALEANRYSDILHDKVTAINPNERQDGWTVQTAENGPISVPKVVVCAGARIPAALGEVTLPRLRLPTLYFAKGIGCVVSGAPAFPHAIRTPNRSDACGLHVVPRAGNRLYIGASNHYGYATAAARGITPGEISAILGDTTREINRALRDTTIEQLRFGLRPVVLDDLPLLGRTLLPGLFLATGTFRTGIVMAPLIARIVAAEVLDRDDPVENPFAANEARCYKQEDHDPNHDPNLANVYASWGLSAYNRGKLDGNRADLDQAVNMWRRYIDIAGDNADQRIVDLVHRLEADNRDQDQIW